MQLQCRHGHIWVISVLERDVDKVPLTFYVQPKRVSRLDALRGTTVIKCAQTWHFSSALNLNYSAPCDGHTGRYKPCRTRGSPVLMTLSQSVSHTSFSICCILKRDLQVFPVVAPEREGAPRPSPAASSRFARPWDRNPTRLCHLPSPSRWSTGWGSRERRDGSRKSNSKNQGRTAGKKRH